MDLRQKSLVMPYTKIFLGLLAPILSACSCAWAQDPGWPRKLVKPGGTVLIYQPQVDDWQNFTDIKWRQAFQLTPTGGKEVVGAALSTTPQGPWTAASSAPQVIYTIPPSSPV
jgi:hypothetical protein